MAAGTRGAGLFYVKEELLPELKPILGGELQAKTWADDSGLCPSELYESAKKFEHATLHFQGAYEARAAPAAKRDRLGVLLVRARQKSGHNMSGRCIQHAAWFKQESSTSMSICSIGMRER